MATSATIQLGKQSWQARGGNVRVHIHSFVRHFTEGEPVVRTIFNIEIKTDVPLGDEKRREVYKKLMLETAKRLYAQSSMIGTVVAPSFTVTMEDQDGIRELGVFGRHEG